MTIEYADSVGKYTLHRRPVQRRRGNWLPGQGEDGYGGKITTDIVLRFVGQRKEHRVYATCFSNAASHWIVLDGRRLHLHDHSQDDIKD